MSERWPASPMLRRACQPGRDRFASPCVLSRSAALLLWHVAVDAGHCEPERGVARPGIQAVGGFLLYLPLGSGTPQSSARARLGENPRHRPSTTRSRPPPGRRRTGHAPDISQSSSALTRSPIQSTLSTNRPRETSPRGAPGSGAGSGARPPRARAAGRRQPRAPPRPAGSSPPTPPLVQAGPKGLGRLGPNPAASSWSRPSSSPRRRQLLGGDVTFPLDRLLAGRVGEEHGRLARHLHETPWPSTADRGSPGPRSGRRAGTCCASASNGTSYAVLPSFTRRK